MSKRANGEGSVYQRKDGRWTGATYVLQPDGGRRRRQVYGTTRAEVSSQLADLKSKTDRGIPASISSWTVESYAAHWLANTAHGSLKPSTVANYTWMMRKHVVPAVGRHRLDNLTPAHVRELHTKVAASGVSSRTVQLAHAVLRTMLSEAMREQLVARNVATLVRTPRVERTDVSPWTPQEAALFLETNRSDPHHSLYLAALALGMRKGELLGLRWSDVDLDARELRVRQTVQRLGAGQGMVIGTPKTNRSRRTIPLPQLAVDALTARRRAQLVDQQLMGERWTELGLVFTTSIGTIIEPTNLRRSFDAAIAKAGVRRIRFHDLRHTCASLLLAEGVPMRVVMEILGHSAMAITSDIYAHVMPSALTNAATAIDSALTRRDS
ncbi:site-specific integrase [Rathayibacter tritici]|uniref:tyrosine-type recombinase/integrase n=1 Tax=Rathayibacter tritici TaxID=33888 RepID=UPI000CE7B3ED|nr:site-specific integrase [Rathayibacter tritici]PPF29923.1 site-specific integrase [Rathayibacter tritici]PPI19933.1 site-specific integrase [Rathayibacter tritici]